MPTDFITRTLVQRPRRWQIPPSVLIAACLLLGAVVLLGTVARTATPANYAWVDEVGGP